MNIHLYCLSVESPMAISYGCSLLIQGVAGLPNINLAANFDNSVKINCNASIGRSSLRSIPIERRSSLGAINILVIDDNVEGGSFPSNPEFWKTVEEIAKVVKVVVITNTDSANLTVYPESIKNVYIAHCSSKYFKNSSYMPQSYGVSQELIEESTAALERQKERLSEKIFFNFGHSLNQSVRQASHFAFVKPFSRRFEVFHLNGNGDSYVDQLLSYEAMFVYGGAFLWKLDDYYQRIGAEDLYRSYDGVYLEEAAIGRWDSWRFWECCMFACAPIMLDFETYGFRLPVMPVPWRDYIPLKFDNVEKTMGILDHYLALNPKYFQQVGLNARKWALENYNPEVRARRILEI